MRESFPYESNALLLSKCFVPDPIPDKDWLNLVTGWKQSGGRYTLLEWIHKGCIVSESEFLGHLASATGSRVFKNMVPLSLQERDAAAVLLESNGFLVGKGSHGERLVAGGSLLPPDLSSFIGQQATDWEWIILNPSRGQSEYDVASPDESHGNKGDKSHLETRLESLLAESATRNVSDIFFERYGNQLHIRGRIDGGIEEIGVWQNSSCMEAIRLIKRWANLSTAETSLPQDGRLELVRGTAVYSFRASHIQAVNGESLVLRIVGEESSLPDPGALGIPSGLVKEMEEILLHESGLVLCTGATGSGKTTTINTVISDMKRYPLKILTIEDPVEHELGNATQCSVNPSTGWTFPKALKAFLRQDPDIILLGEIRDKESAAIACRAGLTGHSVLSSLHGKSVLTALDRFRGWGIPSGLVSESIRLVIHQELVAATGAGARSPEFNWIRTNPGEVYDYMRSRTIPATWAHYLPATQEDAFASSA